MAALGLKLVTLLPFATPVCRVWCHQTTITRVDEARLNNTTHAHREEAMAKTLGSPRHEDLRSLPTPEANSRVDNLDTVARASM